VRICLFDTPASISASSARNGHDHDHSGHQRGSADRGPGKDRPGTAITGH
jgi:hypothetical protein